MPEATKKAHTPTSTAALGTGGVAVLVVAALLTAVPAAASTPAGVPKPGTIVYTTEVDNDNDGTIDYRSTTSDTFDSRGRVVGFVQTDDPGADGADIYSVTGTNTYDSKGRILVQLLETDSQSDGFLDSRRTLTATYDSKGNLTSLLNEFDETADGVVDETTLTAFSAARKSLVLTTTNSFDGNADGSPEFVDTTTRSFDKRGNLLSTVQATDVDGDGDIDSQTTWTNTYTKSGGLLTSQVTGLEGGVVTGTSTTTNTFDSKDRLTQTAIVNEGVGKTQSFLFTYQYDDKDRVILETRTQDDNRDGVTDLSTVIAWTYTRDGLPATITRTLESPSFSAWDRQSYTYDSKGRATLVRSETDDQNDGTIDRVNASASTFDSKGRLVVFATSLDDDNDGTADSTTTTTLEYDDRGILIRVITEVDDDGDGTVDSRTVQERTTA